MGERHSTGSIHPTVIGQFQMPPGPRVTRVKVSPPLCISLNRASSRPDAARPVQVCARGCGTHSGVRDGGVEGGYATLEEAKGRVQDDSGVPKSSSMKTLTLSLSAEARRSSETTTPYRHANTGAPGNTVPIRSLLVCTCLRSFGSNV